MPTKLEFQITSTHVNFRLDDFLYDEIGTLSRIYLTNRINYGYCTVNGEIGRGGYKLREHDAVEIVIEADAATSMTPENIPLDILFEDAEILLVNKPAEMLVHPTKSVKTGTLLNALAFHVNQNNKGKTIRSGLVHRLDKQTSGLMVIAKTPRALRILSDHFQRKLVKKKYLALVEGIIAENSGTISTLIGRVEEVPHWRVTPDGKEAVTNFRVVEKRSDSTLLELEPVTGRTNQLRIHCAFLKHPIVGDTERGAEPFTRLCLHAASLAFYHPNGGWLEFNSELPGDFKSEPPASSGWTKRQREVINEE